MRVLTDDGRDVVPGSGEDGVLAVAGRLPLGYHHDPDATAAHVPRGRRRPLRDARRSCAGPGRRPHRVARAGLGVHQHRRREGVPRGGRAGAAAASRGGRRRRRRCARRALGRDGHCAGRARAALRRSSTRPSASTPVPSSPDTRCRSDSSPSRSCRAPSPASPTTRVCGRWRPDRERGRSGAIDPCAGAVGRGPVRRRRSGGGRRDPPHVPRAGCLGTPGDAGRDGTGDPAG